MKFLFTQLFPFPKNFLPSFFLVSLFCFVGNPSSLIAQQVCTYTLEMFDSFGDGWNNASLDVTIDGVTTNYTVNFNDNNGDFNIVEIEIIEGAEVILNYSAGTFENEVTYNLIDPDGVVVFSDGPFPATGEVYNEIGVCPDCLGVDDDSVVISDITFESATISWEPTDSAMTYIVEYGPQGFEPGMGTIINVTDPTATITGLEEITFYDFYITVDCGDAGTSITIGPFSIFTTFENPPQSCTYVLNLFDSFGDGWNGSVLTVTHNGVSTDYTLNNIDDNGDNATFEFDVFEGLPIILTYAAGAFQNEVTYDLVDPDGIVIFSDGTFPAVGEVYNELADCPDCGIMDIDEVTFTDITFDGATINWAVNDSAFTYILEWGLSGFIPGNGTFEETDQLSFTFTDLDENTLYDVYLTANCGDVNGNSVTIGPLTFQTMFIDPPKMCTYFLELSDSGFSGWDGSFVSVTTNNVTTTYTLDGVNDDGGFATIAVNVLHGFPIQLGYTPMGFNQFQISYRFLDSDGIELFADGTFPTAGDNVFETVAFCPDCPATPPTNFQVLTVSDTTATFAWTPIPEAMNYIIEYGPTGFPLGNGPQDTADISVFQLHGLNPCVTYDAYLTVNCGGDSLSTTIGPFTFTTDYTPGSPGESCTYSIELFDSFGDGWNGNTLVITHDGVSSNYTFTTGFEAFFDVDFTSNLPVTISFIGGAFQNEVTYNIIDQDGNVVWSDGPFPQIGNDLFTFIACPSCPGPVDAQIYDANATNAIMSWTNSPSVTSGSYIIEWGPLGFQLGTAWSDTIDVSNNMYTLTGLTEHTYYDAYIILDCGDEFSKPIGPLTFQTIWMNDVGVSQITTPNVAENCNLTESEIITVGLTNFGQAPQSLFEYFFAVNGEVAPIPIPSDGFFTGVVGNDSTTLVEFETTYDFSVPGYYLIEAWTNLEGDSDNVNDTFRLEIVTAYPLPLMEDFESGDFPENWTTDEFNPIYAPGAHNNETTVCGDNIYSFDPAFEVKTLRVGPLNEADTLTFDYRMVNFFAGTIATELGPGDSLIVEISDDCEMTWIEVMAIDSSNHEPTTDMTNRAVDLSAWAGGAINVRFRGVWGNGDYWLDLDNINILGCPQSLNLIADITDATTGAEEQGSITVEPLFGTGPYTYEWDNGESSSTLTDLTSGVYSVTVTDAMGCVDQGTYQVDFMVDDEEVIPIERITLSPNPTSDIVNLQLDLQRTTDVQIQLFDIEGRIIYEESADQVMYTNHQFDLGAYPAGMYFVRVYIEGKSHYEKLIVTK